MTCSFYRFLFSQIELVWAFLKSMSGRGVKGMANPWRLKFSHCKERSEQGFHQK